MGTALLTLFVCCCLQLPLIISISYDENWHSCILVLLKFHSYLLSVHMVLSNTFIYLLVLSLLHVHAQSHEPEPDCESRFTRIRINFRTKQYITIK